MEDQARYAPKSPPKDPPGLPDDPDFLGAQAAFLRASAKAIARARAAGLEPVIDNPEDWPEED